MDFQRIFGGFSTVWWFCNGYSAELSVTGKKYFQTFIY
jgi:hypothetical protein